MNLKELEKNVKIQNIALLHSISSTSNRYWKDCSHGVVNLPVEDKRGIITYKDQDIHSGNMRFWHAPRMWRPGQQSPGLCVVYMSFQDSIGCCQVVVFQDYILAFPWTVTLSFNLVFVEMIFRAFPRLHGTFTYPKVILASTSLHDTMMVEDVDPGLNLLRTLAEASANM